MSVIIRLQNLPWSANALDIREFFKGLSIPEGGVHIVGGELGDAFIAFGNDEDARLAMRMTGTSLKGIQVTLLLSSRTEMQKVIEQARQQAMALQGYMAAPATLPTPQQNTSTPSSQQPQTQPHPQHQQLQPPPQPPIPQSQMSHPPQIVPQPLQVPPVAPPHLQHPALAPYHLHGMPASADGKQPLPPMPPHMPHAPPNAMQQSMHSLPIVGQHPDSGYNNHGNKHDTDSINGPPASAGSKEEKKEEKKPGSGSVSSTSSSTRRDSKGRDSRRRRSRSRTRSRTRSRSRDRDRDRYRRHRSRTRSRSRDRGSRSHRRSSRSRERDRFKDKSRDRDRGRDRDRDRDRSSRGGRDRSERNSQDSNSKASSSAEQQQNKDFEIIGGTIRGGAIGGIPGLGEIPSINMRGPLPSSLAEPIRNSPIQTPPGPAPPTVTRYDPIPPFMAGVPFPPQMPFNNMSIPPPAIPIPIPVPNPIDTRTDMELIAEDEVSLDQDITSDIQPDTPEPEPEPVSVPLKPPNQFINGPQGQLRGEYPPMYGAMPGDVPVPPMVNRGPGPTVPMRPNEGFGFEGQPGNNYPAQMEGGNGFNHEQLDPRLRPDSVQRNWDPREGSPADMSKFRGDTRSFRGEKDMINKSTMNERDPREGNDMRGGAGNNEMHGNWDPRKRPGHMEEFEPGWDDPNNHNQEGMKESSWNGRGRSDNYHPRNEENFHGRNDREPFGGRNEPDGWFEQEKWGGQDGYNRDQERFDEEGDYEENYNSRGYRGRGGRGWDRGRGWERGRGSRGGFNPRHRGEFIEGPHEEGYGPRGGRGGYRPRGQSRWGGGGQYNEETASVEMRNIPLTASYRSIREFFQDIYVPNGSIKILGDSHGSRTDVAYIRLSHPRDAMRATKFSGNYLYDNIIEMSLLSESKYDSGVDIKQLTGNRGYRGAPPEVERNFMNESPCVYVTGIPLGCTDHNVAQVFEKFQIEDIVIERVRGTRTPSGGCFVRLHSFEEAQKAIAELADASIDGSPLRIELCPISAMAPAVRDRDIIQGKAPGEKNEKSQDTKALSEQKIEMSPDEQPVDIPVPKKSATPAPDLLTDSVIIKRVPKDATEANVRDFFSDEGLVPERIHFCDIGTNGVREVYVMFPLINDAKRALGKNEQMIGKMKVYVELIAKPLVMSAMNLPFDPLELIQKGHKSMTILKEPLSSKTHVKIPPVGSNSLSSEGESELMMKSRQFAEEEMDLSDPKSYDSQSSFSGGRMAGPYPGGRGFMPRTEFRGVNRNGGSGRPGMGDFGQGRSPLMRSSPTTTSEDNIGTAIPPEHFGKPACVVALTNLPYRSTTDDILYFFREFPGLRPEHIIRRYNELNQPTADARVAFASPQDAQRAIQSHDRGMMDQRPISVSLVL